jgi:hypothetical protein
MDVIHTAETIRDRFMAGRIPVEEVLLNIEPILVESASDPAGQAEVRKIVNQIERIAFTENEPRRCHLIAVQLTAAIAFIRAHSTEVSR